MINPLLIQKVREYDNLMKGIEGARPEDVSLPVASRVVPLPPFVGGPQTLEGMASNIIQNANRQYQESITRPQQPVINSGTGNTMLAIGALARLLGASHEDVMGAGNAFMGGLAQRAAEQRQREDAAAQLQFQDATARADRLQRIAQESLDAQFKNAQIKEQRKNQALDLIVQAGKASSPAEAAAILRRAKELGGTVDRGQVQATMRQISERAELQKIADEEKRMAARTLAGKRILDGPFKQLRDSIAKLADNPADSSGLFTSLRQNYDQIAAQYERVTGEPLPVSFNALVSETIQQAGLRMREAGMSQRVAEFKQRQFEFEQEDKRLNAKSTADIARIYASIDRDRKALDIDARREARLAMGASGASAQPDNVLGEWAIKEWNTLRNAYGSKFQIKNWDDQEAMAQAKRTHIIELVKAYSNAVQTLGPSNKQVIAMQQWLNRNNIPVATPEKTFNVMKFGPSSPQQFQQQLGAAFGVNIPQNQGGGSGNRAGFP